MKKRADGRWLKVKTIDGVRVSFYSTAKTEKQALKDIEAQMLAYSENNRERKHKFKILAENALDLQSQGIAYNTIECYTHALKHLKPFFELNIEDISPAMVQQLIDNMVKKYDYSFSSVAKTKVVFGLILDYAIVHEHLPLVNFVRSIKIPKTVKKGKVTAPPDEVTSIIINNANKVDFGMWSMMLLCTGLRRGELTALRKKNIDFDKNEIDIKNAVEFISNSPHVKDTPKSDASIDTVPLLDILKPHLEDLCKGLKPNDFIFGGEKPLTKAQIDKRLKKYCNTIGHSFTGHQLRHAYAKLLYKAGVDVKTAQRLLRHADFATTMNIYTDFDNEVTTKSVGILNMFTKQLVNY